MSDSPVMSLFSSEIIAFTLEETPVKMVTMAAAKDHPESQNNDNDRPDEIPGNVDVKEFFSQEKGSDQDQNEPARISEIMLEANKQTQHNEAHGPGKKPVRKEIAQVI